MIEPFCGICGVRRTSHKYASVDKRCPNMECIAYNVGIYFDMGAMYDMLLEINKLSKS